MINIILACSETDETLGMYFSLCSDDLKNFIETSCNQQFALQEIKGRALNSAYLEIFIEQLESQRLILAAYSHGREHALTHEGSAYVEIGQNFNLYSNALVYTNACLAGKGEGLGQYLVENGCSAFCGYNDEVVACVPYYDMFCECENHGIKQFLQGEALSIAFLQMKNKYTEKIDELYEYSVVAAALLRKNRDALVLLGDSELVINDFMNCPNC